MATALSQIGGLLVVREQQSNLPNLGKQGRFSPENIVVVAQMQGEAHEAFVSRVLGRCQRELEKGLGLRAVSVSVDAGLDADRLASRQHLLLKLAKMLAVRPGAELSICAPERLGAAEQIALFELAELALRTVPSVNIRIHFTSCARAGEPRRRASKSTRQPAAA